MLRIMMVRVISDVGVLQKSAPVSSATGAAAGGRGRGKEPNEGGTFSTTNPRFTLNSSLFPNIIQKTKEIE